MISKWLAVALLLFAGTAQAKWDFEVAPFLWGISLEGDLAVRGLDAPVNADFDQLVDVLDGGGGLHFEATNGRWVVLTDLVYIDVGQEFDSLPGEVDVEQGVLELGAGYRRAEDFDILFGLRWVSIESELRFDAPLSTTVGGEQDWVDPFVGIRWQPELVDNWRTYLRADVGGFEVGADLAWQLRLGFIWEFSQSARLAIGYRQLSEDYDDGEGDTRFEYDVFVSGLEVGVGFGF